MSTSTGSKVIMLMSLTFEIERVLCTDLTKSCSNTTAPSFKGVILFLLHWNTTLFQFVPMPLDFFFRGMILRIAYILPTT